MITVWRGLGSVVRGAGAMIDNLGAFIQGPLAPMEGLIPSLTRLPVSGVTPTFGEHVFVAPNAAVMGQVTLGARSSVWYGATLRGDVNSVTVGHTTNIQDRAIVHVARYNPEGNTQGTVIGNQVTIGHGAIIHACTIEDDVLVGMGAKVLDGAVIRRNAIVAAGAVVAPGTEVPSGQVWAGCPAKFLRDLDPGEVSFLSLSAKRYSDLAMQHWEEATKVYLKVLHDDMIQEDIQYRDPNSDVELGLKRDTYTREITGGPLDPADSSGKS